MEADYGTSNHQIISNNDSLEAGNLPSIHIGKYIILANDYI